MTLQKQNEENLLSLLLGLFGILLSGRTKLYTFLEITYTLYVEEL
jgi:hypothetical protein